MFIHNKNISKHERNLNEKYNRDWIKKHKLLFTESVSLKNIDIEYNLKLDANPFMIVWLKNIVKLRNMLPSSYKIEEYNLIDVGCGTGISTLYFLLNYNFKSIVGFDFSKDLIFKANKNKEIIKNTKTVNNIKFVVSNAQNHIIRDEKNLIFLFNPFGWETLELFIKNNLSILYKKSNIIAYANDIYINKLSFYSKKIKRIDEFNLSLIFF